MRKAPFRRLPYGGLRSVRPLVSGLPWSPQRTPRAEHTFGIFGVFGFPDPLFQTPGWLKLSPDRAAEDSPARERWVGRREYPAPERGERESPETDPQGRMPLSPRPRAGSVRSVPMAHAMGFRLSPGLISYQPSASTLQKLTPARVSGPMDPAAAWARLLCRAPWSPNGMLPSVRRWSFNVLHNKHPRELLPGLQLQTIPIFEHCAEF